MRFFSLIVGNFIAVTPGTYDVSLVDMDNIFINSGGYNGCRIYDDRKSLIASIRLNPEPCKEQIHLRRLIKSDAKPEWKRLVFVLSSIRSKRKIINFVTGLLHKPDRVITLRTGQYVNVTTKKA